MATATEEPRARQGGVAPGTPAIRLEHIHKTYRSG